MKKRMKDRPGLLDDAQRLADAGRKGDKLVAHITPEEAALLKARGGSGTVNPRTGLLEFFSESDPMGSGSDYGYSDGRTDADRAASENATNSMVGAMNAAATAPMYDEDAQKAQYQPRDLFTRARDWAMSQPREFFQDLRDKPFATMIDLAVPGLLGLGNMAAKATTGKSVGGALTGLARDITDYDNRSGNQTMAAMGEPDGPPGDPNPGESNFGRPSDAPATPQQVASQTTPTQVAQEALRRAFMVNPALLNQWQGNQFMTGGTAGRPNAYNQWQGNQLYRHPVFPGLIG